MRFSVLVADDEKMPREILRDRLPWEELGVERVDAASDGAEALELARQHRPDIIISDVKMPRMNGLELAGAVREMYPECQFIFLSGYTDKEYLKGAIKLRAAIIPITNIGSKLAMPLILIGLLFVSGDLGVQLAYAGIACFGLSTVFQLVTLPTEFNASHRALAALEQGHLLNEEEMVGARKTLWAAAMTYVAALAVSLAQLFRLLLIVGNRRRND